MNMHGDAGFEVVGLYESFLEVLVVISKTFEN